MSHPLDEHLDGAVSRSQPSPFDPPKLEQPMMPASSTGNVSAAPGSADQHARDAEAYDKAAPIRQGAAASLEITAGTVLGAATGGASAGIAAGIVGGGLAGTLGTMRKVGREPLKQTVHAPDRSNVPPPIPPGGKRYVQEYTESPKLEPEAPARGVEMPAQTGRARPGEGAIEPQREKKK